MTSAKHQKEAKKTASPSPTQSSSPAAIPQTSPKRKDEEDEETGKALLIQQAAVKLANSGDLESAYKKLLQAAKLHSKLFRLRSTAECYLGVIGLQHRLFNQLSSPAGPTNPKKLQIPSFHALPVPTSLSDALNVTKYAYRPRISDSILILCLYPELAV